MNEIIIEKDSFLFWRKRESDRMKGNLDIKAKLAIEHGKPLANYDNLLIEIGNSSIINSVISILSQKGHELLSLFHEEQILNEPRIKAFGYFFKMITSHCMFFEDFEFYNIALIIRYLMESITGIIANIDNLEKHFKPMSEEGFKEKMGEYNAGISANVGKYLGKEFKVMYKNLSRYAHPMNGPLFGLSPRAVSLRNHELIKWSIKLYLKGAKEIFKILGYTLIIDFEDWIYDCMDKAKEESIKEEYRK